MHGEHEERFPNYILIWGILVLLTGSSIAASVLVKDFAPGLRALLVAFLFILGAIKASLVALNFMHLRFETKVLWVLGSIALLFVAFFFLGTWLDITLTEKR